jgi:hypothetical protein
MVFRKIIAFYCLHPVVCYNTGFLAVNIAIKKKQYRCSNICFILVSATCFEMFVSS